MVNNTERNCAPHRLSLRWTKNVVRGILFAGCDPGMIECLECPLTRPVISCKLGVRQRRNSLVLDNGTAEWL